MKFPALAVLLMVRVLPVVPVAELSRPTLAAAVVLSNQTAVLNAGAACMKSTTCSAECQQSAIHRVHEIRTHLKY